MYKPWSCYDEGWRRSVRHNH